MAVALGAFGRAHDASFGSIPTLGFSSVLQMKSVLASVALVFACVQVVSALRMYGRIGSGPASRYGHPGPPHLGCARRSHHPPRRLRVPLGHRLRDPLDADLRALAPRAACSTAFFVAKMLSLHTKRIPGWALPWLGGLTFATLVGLWLTSALWYFSKGSSY